MSLKKWEGKFVAFSCPEDTVIRTILTTVSVLSIHPWLALPLPSTSLEATFPVVFRHTSEKWGKPENGETNIKGEAKNRVWLAVQNSCLSLISVLNSWGFHWPRNWGSSPRTQCCAWNFKEFTDLLELICGVHRGLWVRLRIFVWPLVREFQRDNYFVDWPHFYGCQCSCQMVHGCCHAYLNEWKTALS